MVEESKGRGEGLQVFCYDGAADLDDCELLRGDGGEVGEVLLDLTLGADVAEQLDDGRAGREVRLVARRGVAASLSVCSRAISQRQCCPRSW